MIKLVTVNKKDLSEVRVFKKQKNLRYLLENKKIFSKKDKLSFLEELSQNIINHGRDTMIEFHHEGEIYYLGSYRSMRDHTPYVFFPTMEYFTPNRGIGAISEKWYSYEFPEYEKGLCAGLEGEYCESNIYRTSKRIGIIPILLTLLKSEGEFFFELDSLERIKENGFKLRLNSQEWENLKKHFSLHKLREKYPSEVVYYSPLAKFI